jgi:hypothetical protein
MEYKVRTKLPVSYQAHQSGYHDHGDKSNGFTIPSKAARVQIAEIWTYHQMGSSLAERRIQRGLACCVLLGLGSVQYGRGRSGTLRRGQTWRGEVPAARVV